MSLLTLAKTRAVHGDWKMWLLTSTSAFIIHLLMIALCYLSLRYCTSAYKHLNRIDRIKYVASLGSIIHALVSCISVLIASVTLCGTETTTTAQGINE